MKKYIFLICCAWCITVHAQQFVDNRGSEPVNFKNILSKRNILKNSPAKADGLSSLQRAVGYIVNNNPDSITISGAMVGTAGTYPLAAAITTDMLRDYIGCKIIGIRIAAAQSLGKSDVWLHPIDASGFVSEDGLSKSQRLYEGWNNVFFNGDTSWEIKEGESLLVGFNYVETENMISSEKGGICTVGESQGNDFLIFTDFGSGEGWYSINNLGSLCVQLIVDISSLPEKMLSLTYLDTGFRYKKAGENIEMYTIASNIGRNSLNSYTVSCQIDDNAPVNFVYEKSLSETATDHQQPVLPLPDDISIGSHQLTVTLLADNDEIPVSEKATKSVSFYIYGETLQRQKNYVEQYNSQNKYMASIVNPIFNQSAQDNNVMALVNVYSPESSLSVEQSQYLHHLYAYTVPSFTINRSYFPGEDYIAYDVNYYAEQYAVLVPSIIEDLMYQDLMQPAFATIQLQPTYHADTRELTVDVEGKLAEDATDIFKDLSLTLLLTENNVKADQMVVNDITGRTSIKKDYNHQHVLRQYITPALGTPVTISGNHYTAHHSCTINPDYDVDQITLIGFLTRGAETVTDENVINMDITNCNSVSLNGITGIQNIQKDAKQNTDTEYYTLDGQKINTENIKFGIYIIKKADRIRKIIVK